MPVAEPPAPEVTDSVIKKVPVSRRAPFSDNPDVGPRGQRTQQRILTAALDVLHREGYHRCSIDRITRAAGCSRASFYQYFSSREEVLRHLTVVVAHELATAIDSLDRITADQAGWEAVRALVGRYGEIYRQYGAVFLAFESAV